MVSGVVSPAVLHFIHSLVDRAMDHLCFFPKNVLGFIEIIDTLLEKLYVFLDPPLTLFMYKGSSVIIKTLVLEGDNLD